MLLALAFLQVAQERDGGHCAGLFCDLASLSLCTSVCSPLVRKGFICSSACFTQTWQDLSVRFIVSWDQIREGMVTTRQFTILVQGFHLSPPSSVQVQCHIVPNRTTPLVCSQGISP